MIDDSLRNRLDALEARLKVADESIQLAKFHYAELRKELDAKTP